MFASVVVPVSVSRTPPCAGGVGRLTARSCCAASVGRATSFFGWTRQLVAVCVAHGPVPIAETFCASKQANDADHACSLPRRTLQRRRALNAAASGSSGQATQSAASVHEHRHRRSLLGRVRFVASCAANKAKECATVAGPGTPHAQSPKPTTWRRVSNTRRYGCPVSRCSQPNVIASSGRA